MSGDFLISEALGVRVIEIADLGKPVLFIRDHNLALVDADLTDEARAEASDWLLSAVAAGASR